MYEVCQLLRVSSYKLFVSCVMLSAGSSDIPFNNYIRMSVNTVIMGKIQTVIDEVQQVTQVETCSKVTPPAQWVH